MKTLAVYLMAGAETPELAEAAVEGGADIIEIGFPFSDPLADGPVIRRAGERALAAGMRTEACLACLASGARASRCSDRADDVRVAPRGVRLRSGSRPTRSAAGATSLIVADLPAGAHPELRRIQLVAPTSTDERLRLAADETDGWLYLVSLTGTTGARTRSRRSSRAWSKRARRATSKRLYAGFGISTPEHAAAAAALADGVVVGTRAVEVAEEGPERPPRATLPRSAPRSTPSSGSQTRR